MNIKGEVVGINSVIYSESGGSQGVGFAIPSNLVKRAMASIIKKGRVIRGYLGVSIQPMTKEIAEQFKLDNTKGALVTDVSPGSPAERAGIIRGDVIRKVDNYEIRDTAALINRISEADIGSQLTIDLVREGQPKTVTASVVEQPADMMARLSRNQNSKPGGGTSTMFAGVEVQDLTPQLRQEAKVAENVNGVIVTAIDPSSATAQELRPGDVIEEVNRRAVNNLREFQQIVGQLDPDRPVVVGIARGRQRSFVIVQPG